MKKFKLLPVLFTPFILSGCFINMSDLPIIEDDVVVSSYFKDRKLTLDKSSQFNANEVANMVENLIDEYGYYNYEMIDNMTRMQMDRFFLVFVSKDCSNCKVAEEGFELAASKFRDFSGEGDESEEGTYIGRLTTSAIYVDEFEDGEYSFVNFIYNHSSFFETAAINAKNSPYYQSGHIAETDIEAIETCDPDNFVVPTVFYIDVTTNYDTIGVVDIIIGASDKESFAKTLIDCYFAEGEFSRTK